MSPTEAQPSWEGLDCAQAWQPLVKLGAALTSRNAPCVLSGWLAPNSCTVSTGDSWSGLSAATRQALSTEVQRIQANNSAGGSFKYELTVHLRGDGSLLLVGASDAAHFHVGSRIASVTARPGLLPDAFRRQAEVGLAKTAAGSDPEAVAQAIKRALPHETGADKQELDNLADTLGVPLGEELRALWSAARTGILRIGDTDYRGGYRIVPPSEALARVNTPERVFTCSCCANQEPRANMLRGGRPDVIQELVGTPLWVPFAADCDHDAYSLAVDLAPGPRGHLGQVLMLDEDYMGAQYVSSSLADLLAGRCDMYSHTQVRGESRRVQDPVWPCLTVPQWSDQLTGEFSFPTAAAALVEIGQDPLSEVLRDMNGLAARWGVAALPAMRLTIPGPSIVGGIKNMFRRLADRS